MTNDKKHVVIEETSYYWECGDGCCSEHGVDYKVILNGVTVLDERTYDFDAEQIKLVLEALGYDVYIEYKPHENYGGRFDWDDEDWEDEDDDE